MRVELPNYSTIIIKEPQNWNKGVLKSFVDNKEVQNIVKSLNGEGIVVSARCGDKQFPITADNIFLWDEKKRMVISNIIVEKDNKSFGYGTVSGNIKGVDAPKPLKAKDFFEYLLKKHEYNLENIPIKSKMFALAHKILAKL